MAVTATSTFTADLETHLRSIRERDIEAFAQTIAPDPLLVGPGGSLLRGYDDVVRAHREWFATTEFTFDTEVVSQNERSDAAWTLLRVTYATAAERSSFLLLLLFVPVEGRWKLIYDQNTPGA